jgi:hypothetical protein
MALNTYGELQASIADWADREDLTLQIKDFIRLAETEIYRDLRCRENEFVVTYNTTGWTISGHSEVADTDGAFLVLPPNFKEMKEVAWAGNPLVNISNQQLDKAQSIGIDPAPWAFAINGRTINIIQPLDSDQTTWDTDTLVYTYYGTESLDSMPTWQVGDNPVETPPIEDTTPEDNTQTDANTTRLLQVSPDLYLHGALYYASLFLKNDTEALKWGDLFKRALQDMKRESRLSNYSGSTVAVTNGGSYAY